MLTPIAFLLFSLVLQANSNKLFAPVVQTKLGPVRGLVVEVEGRQVDFYQGIRYGQVTQRFAPAKMASPWTEVYNATHYRWACPQIGKKLGRPKSEDENSPDLMHETSVMSEDCLFLNLWRPSNSSNTSLPVMVWIHGGGFSFETIFSSQYDGRVLASLDNVIIISIAYRLGPFGFLYTGSPDSPGNQGLMDQLLALKWIQGNVDKFGGDPNQVTIFGQSAGSISVGILILSPQAKGLFNRAIMQSGAPNAKLLTTGPGDSLRKARLIAESVNCSQPEVPEMLKCLRRVPVEILSTKGVIDAANLADSLGPTYGTSVLPELPAKLLNQKNFSKVDLLYGITRDEGSGFVAPIIPELNPEMGNITVGQVKQWIKIVAQKMNISQDIEEVVKFYSRNLGANSTQQELRETVFSVFGDYVIVCPTILFGEKSTEINAHAQNKQFAYRMMEKPSELGTSCPEWRGICHGSETFYVFGIPIMARGTSFYRKADEALSRVIMRAWLNFAKTGSPGKIGETQWEQGSAISTQVMYLRNQHFRMVKGAFSESCDHFWKPKLSA